jgi:hypothetical protein
VKPYAVLVPVKLSGPRTGSLTVTVPVSAASEDVARTLASTPGRTICRRT